MSVIVRNKNNEVFDVCHLRVVLYERLVAKETVVRRQWVSETLNFGTKQVKLAFRPPALRQSHYVNCTLIYYRQNIEQFLRETQKENSLENTTWCEI